MTAHLSPDAPAPSHPQRPVQQLSWQRPFQYEAKVYASLNPDVPTNATSYFEAAQLLWHIPPQSVENKYPLIRHKASVDIPSVIRSGLDFDQGLYVRIFIQEAGQFSPHPNLSDPRLVTSRLPLVLWKSGPLNNSNVDISLARGEETVSELVCVTSVSWAIVLENQAYNWFYTPSRNLPPSAPTFPGFYNPPLLRNDFTKSRPKVRPLAGPKGKVVETGVYPSTIDVELELSGVMLGWIFARVQLDEHISPVDKTVIVKRRVPAPWNSTQTVTVDLAEVVKDDGYIPLGEVRRLSAPLVFVFILSRRLMATMVLVQIRMVLYLSSIPASRWRGVSRTTIALLIIGYIMKAVSTMDKFGVFTLRLLPDLLAIYMLANVDDMGFVLLVVPTWLIRKTFGLKSSSNLARPSSAKQRDTVATDRDDSDATAPNAMALSHFERPNSIVAIRRMVDEVAMYWLYMLSILVVIMAMVYALLRQLNYFSSPSSFAELSARSIPIVRRLSWLPQVVVSYKTKSGSPVPVTCALYSLAYAMLSTSIYYLSGCDKFGVVTVYSLPTYLVHIVMIWQWIVYRKLKQE